MITTTKRPPDIFHDKDEDIPKELIPSGCYLHKGKSLMLIARACKPPVPYGDAQKRTYFPGSTKSRKETVGILVFNEDRERFTLAEKNRNFKNRKDKLS